MSRAILLLVLLFPILASAQPMVGHPHAKPAAADQAVSPIQTGQAGFAAIQEIVAILEADTTTDWTKVDVEALRQHLARLPEGQRQAIEMLKLKEMSLKEASAASGQSVGALKVAVHRGIKALRALMGDGR